MKGDAQSGLSFREAKLGWLLPVALCCLAVFGKSQTANVAWSAAAASFSGMLCLRAVNYRVDSFVTMTTVMFLVFYPFAALCNLVLLTPAVRLDLWNEAESAMWTCCVGLVAMRLGVFLSDLKADVDSHQTIHAPDAFVPSRIVNVALMLIIPIVVAIKLKLGIYFHSSIAPYNFKASSYQNLLENLTWIGYCGLALQIFRYTRLKNKWDAAIAVSGLIGFALIYLPSGSRMQSVGFLPAMIVLYLSLESRARVRAWILALAIIVLPAAVSLSGIYRSLNLAKDAPSGSRLELLISRFTDDSRPWRESEFLKVTTNRISDFVATGRIVSATPEYFDFRGFEGMSQWWQIAVPGVMRPEFDRIDFNDGTLQTFRYEISDGQWTSTPIMILSDLYGRFSWLGMVLGMVLIGLIYKRLDAILSDKSDIKKLLFYFLYMRFVWQIHSSSLLVLVASLTRELISIFIMASAIAWIAGYASRKLQPKLEAH